MIDQILQFPRQVMQSDKSINAIAADLKGMFPDGLPEFDEIVFGLRSNETLIDEWVAYSENKRNTPSWYILRQGNFFKIGYVGADRTCNEGIFEDACFACAVFIKLELGDRLSVLK